MFLSFMDLIDLLTNPSTSMASCQDSFYLDAPRGRRLSVICVSVFSVYLI